MQEIQSSKFSDVKMAISTALAETTRRIIQNTLHKHVKRHEYTVKPPTQSTTLQDTSIESGILKTVSPSVIDNKQMGDLEEGEDDDEEDEDTSMRLDADQAP